MRRSLAVLFSVALVASACGALHPPSSTAASSSRLGSPSPDAGPAPGVRLSAPSTSVLWALVDDVHLYRSTDRGDHWELRPAASFPSRHVSFVDDHEGWLLAPGSPATQCQEELAIVWHTIDAGATWRQMPARGIAPAQCKDGIWFFDAEHGFVSASDPNQRPTVYRTSDGGATWTGSTLPDPAYFKSATGGFTLHVDWMRQFGPTLYLEASGSQDDPNLPHDNQFVLRSADGGVSWTYLTKVPSLAVVMVTESRWLDFTAPDQPFESINGGQQFHPLASDFNSDAPGATRFDFADAQVGYATGAGLIQRTADGGTHWTRLSTPGAPARIPTPAVMPSPIPMPSDAVLSAPDDRVVWALVAGQYLFRSTDQGRTWRQRSTPDLAGGGDRLISFADDTTGWIMRVAVPATQCAQQGVQLYRTSDGGATWTVVTVAQYGHVSPDGFAFERCKEAMYFADTRHGFVGAADSTGETVYRTSDGGVTWSASEVPNPPGYAPGGGRLDVKAIRQFGDTVLVYAYPYIFQSTDGGATWKGIAAQTDKSGLAISFLSPAHWLILQAGLESTDAGRTWHFFTTDYADAAGVSSNFVFVDEKVGYSTVRGDVQRTVDGGAHWEPIKGSWP